ncbi:extradiol dioxygenase [Pseudaminobacter sp. 19-2017]|uniref:Extradiol dioxygenase n=1 Tax=Pseudaminobacter soli (ex Zhang et al. 2022) TaxID=2831468 RepID=A0A942DVG3_9HYPH|nr:VOC family protein [Pseudaminobacter soli]MBS3647383.1 extradiol dioxygenase [Pseudaminobacter soli]
MISGAHVVVYSTDPEADRRFFRDVLNFPAVDAGGGWLIFALPPAEVAVHPTAEGSEHDLYLTCEDIQATVKELTAHNIQCGGVSDEGWGLLTEVVLPSGARLGLYEPRHPRAVHGTAAAHY